MRTLIETFGLTNILQPAQLPGDARQDAVQFGPNLTVQAGAMIATKTADGKIYNYDTGASDGTQTAVGLNMYQLKTDGTGLVYHGDSGIVSGVRIGPWMTSPIWSSGIFLPSQVVKQVNIAQVDTFTPTTPTTGDVFTVTLNDVNGTLVTSVSFTVGATQTAAAVVTGLTAAWAANATAAQYATASGSGTFILTSRVAGTPFYTVGSVVGTGTLPKASTTANSSTVSAATAAQIQTAFGTGQVRVLHNGNVKIK